MPKIIVGLGAAVALGMMMGNAHAATLRVEPGSEPGTQCYTGATLYLMRAGPLDLFDDLPDIGFASWFSDECPSDTNFPFDCYLGDDGEYQYACISHSGTDNACEQSGVIDYIGSHLVPIEGNEDWEPAGGNRVRRPAAKISSDDVDDQGYECFVNDWTVTEQYWCDIGYYAKSSSDDSSLVCEVCPSTGVVSGTTEEVGASDSYYCYARMGDPFKDNAGTGTFEGGDCFYSKF